MVAALLGGLVHPTNHFGKELHVEIGEEHADRARFARDEASGPSMGGVPKARGNLANPLAGLLADRPAVVEYPGDGRDRHVCLSGDILDRGHRLPGTKTHADLCRQTGVIVYIDPAACQ